MRKLIFLPWAISVAILCIGSLINFHQYRIWHKPLMPEFVATKRESEKSLKTLDLHSFSVKIIPVHASPEGIFLASDQIILSDVSVFLSEPSFLQTIARTAIGSNGLRAPPLA
ncbi:MAG: hypothetical protein NTU98_03440 [Bacteroidetes bacterium]|nr:hypothetical protein [Bacteroidota bacterium]